MNDHVLGAAVADDAEPGRVAAVAQRHGARIREAKKAKPQTDPSHRASEPEAARRGLKVECQEGQQSEEPVDIGGFSVTSPAARSVPLKSRAFSGVVPRLLIATAPMS